MWPFQGTLLKSYFSKEDSFLAFQRHMLIYVFSKSAAQCIFLLPCSNSHRCFPTSFHKAREIYNKKNVRVEFEKVGQRGTEWREALPPTLPEPPLDFFLAGGGPYFYWGLLVLFSPWKPKSCPLRKLLSAEGTADPLSPFRSVAAG